MATVLRLLWRQYRFELIASVAIIALLVAFAVVSTIQLDSGRPTSDLLLRCTETDGGLDAPECSGVAAWLGLRETEAFRLFGFAPFVAGVLLGSVLVSREIEHRTAGLGWSLSGARTRWLAERAVPVGALLLLCLALLSVASDRFEAARYPDVSSSASLHEYGQRGLVLIARGIAAFGGALLIGAAVGRQLPALVLGGALALGLGYGIPLAFPFGADWQWMTEREVRTEQSALAYRFGMTGYRSSDGTILNYQEASASAPPGLDSGEADDWLYANFTPVVEVLRGDQLGDIVAREAAVLGAFAIVSLGASFVLVARRRPY